MNIGSHRYFFQYRLISCYVFLLISLAVYAQSGRERFVGRVVDSETYEPVPFATVRLLALPDSAILAGGATDAQGKFQLAAIAPKNKSLLLHISFIGYTPVYRAVSPVTNDNKNILGDIPFTSEAIALDETIVVGQAPMAVTEG
ncbi:carboxypeptidase-like regulatory domain-containing protein, partial [Bacteroides acidifaciens]